MEGPDYGVATTRTEGAKCIFRVKVKNWQHRNINYGRSRLRCCHNEDGRRKMHLLITSILKPSSETGDCNITTQSVATGYNFKVL
jgi:hypothetical protein